MRKTTILALASALLCAGAASAHPRDNYRDDAYEYGHPRAPGGYERGYRYEYGDPRGPVYGAGERHERRYEYERGYVGGDRYGATGDRYYGGHARRPIGYSLPTYGDAAQFYGYPCAATCRGWRPAPCASGCGGELVLGSSFFYDAGGVGPIPDGGFYGGGGGFVYAGAGAGASASASASAYAASRASFRFRGGHKGGKPCCHGGKGK